MEDKMISQLIEFEQTGRIDSLQFLIEYNMHKEGIGVDFSTYLEHNLKQCGFLLQKEHFSRFFINFVQEGMNCGDPLGSIRIINFFIEKYGEPFEISNSWCYILIRLVCKVITIYDFHQIKIDVIKLLVNISPFCPNRCVLEPGLFDSIMVLFLNDQETQDYSLDFLTCFFNRDDSIDVIPDIIMSLIVALPNYSPPIHKLWKFLCFFFRKFLVRISEMCDFDSIEPNGLMPVFTRSLLWDLRMIYQNPPETNHEECFWLLWDTVLKECLVSPPDSQFQKMCCFFMNELRLSILWSLKSSVSDNESIPDCVKSVWKSLISLYPSEILQMIDTQFEPSFNSIVERLSTLND